MFSLTGRKPPLVPVVPGPGGPVEPPAACSACGKGGRYEPLGADGLCVDFKACIGRWRGTMSPETYGAGLRGEILAVAP